MTDVAVSLGSGESVLERRAEAERLADEVAGIESNHARIGEDASRASTEADTAASLVEAARAEESRASGARRSAEDAERLAARQLEAMVRESAWQDAQAERLGTELERVRTLAEGLRDEPPSTDDDATGGQGAPDGAAITAWEARAADLRARRDRLAENARSSEATRREAEHRRARAEASAQLAEERMARADHDLELLGDRERALTEARDALRDEIASTTERELAARAALAATRAADAADRERLALAEQEAAAARDRLRTADERLRTADHADLEARLGLDGLREGVIAELAGLGPLGISRLYAAAGVEAGARTVSAMTVDDELGRIG